MYKGIWKNNQQYFHLNIKFSLKSFILVVFTLIDTKIQQIQFVYELIKAFYNVKKAVNEAVSKLSDFEILWIFSDKKLLHKSKRFLRCYGVPINTNLRYTLFISAALSTLARKYHSINDSLFTYLKKIKKFWCLWKCLPVISNLIASYAAA